VPQALLTALTSLVHELSRQLTQAAGRGSFGQFVTPYPPPSVPELLLLQAKIATAPRPTAESAERIPTLNFIESSLGEPWATVLTGHPTLGSFLDAAPSPEPQPYARPIPSSASMRTSSPSCPNEPLFTRV
jgi:hypothetical protein